MHRVKTAFTKRQLWTIILWDLCSPARRQSHTVQKWYAHRCWDITSCKLAD